MEIIRDPESFDRIRFARPVATLGVFDGVHLGHQHLIQGVRSWSQELGGAPTVVITFRDHPLSVLGKLPPAILTSLDHRLVLLDRLDVDVAVVLEFDREMASWRPERFAQQLLIDQLGCSHLLLGHDAAFGRNAEGTAEYFAGRDDVDIEVRSCDAYLVDDKPVSSTEIRGAILKGELERAARLLGRPVSIYGEVIHGDGRGRTLGFPTANLNLYHSAAPPHGVYIAEVATGDTTCGALVNIGRRPTFLGQDDPLDYSRFFNEQLDKVEVYLHGEDIDLYGKHLEATLHEKLRDERRFDGTEALVAQIRKDVAALEAWRAQRD